WPLALVLRRGDRSTDGLCTWQAGQRGDRQPTRTRPTGSRPGEDVTTVTGSGGLPNGLRLEQGADQRLSVERPHVAAAVDEEGRHRRYVHRLGVEHVVADPGGDLR